jgi:hypothetical protein
MVPRNRFASRHVPLEALHDRREIGVESGAQPKEMGQPTDGRRQMLEGMRTYGDGEITVLGVGGLDAPGPE